jgi:hypothetical protein
MPLSFTNNAVTLSGSAPVTINGATAVVATSPNMLGGWSALDVYAIIAGNTGGTLDVYLQTSPDGVTWFDWFHYAQLAAGAAASAKVLRAVRPGAAITQPVTIGNGLFPALAANTATGADWGVAMRIVAVSGAGSTVGGSIAIMLATSIVGSAS